MQISLENAMQQQSELETIYLNLSCLKLLKLINIITLKNFRLHLQHVAITTNKFFCAYRKTTSKWN